MIETSSAWKLAQKEILAPEGFIEITYEITEPGLQGDATESDNGTAFWSEPQQVTASLATTGKKYTSLEFNFWGLDGSYAGIPNREPFGDTGYISSEINSTVEPRRLGSFVLGEDRLYEASDGRTTFKTPPQITLRFSTVHTLPLEGLTFDWGEEYPTEFTVTAYNRNTVVANSVVKDNRSSNLVLKVALANYDRIVITITKWQLPYRRARLRNLLLGLDYKITKKDLIRYSHSQIGDMLSASLPKNSVTFSLDNIDGKWNPDNLGGKYKYLAERQRIFVKYGFMLGTDIEWIDGGVFFISEWDTPANGLEATFTARDVIEFMGEDYAGPRSGSLFDIAISALSQAELPVMRMGGDPWYVDPILGNFTVDFSEDTSNYPISQILQMCANAAGCVMFQDRKGVLHIRKMSKGYTGYAINKFNSYTHPESKMWKPLKSVNVNEGMAVLKNNPVGEIQFLNNPLIQNTNQATHVAEWVRTTLNMRNEMSGSFRGDPRLDVFDVVSLESKYGHSNALALTEITHEFTGVFRSSYVGRVTDFEPDNWYSGELRAGDFD